VARGCDPQRLARCALALWTILAAAERARAIEIPQPEGSAPEAAYELSLLSYNTHGLRFTGDDPARRFSAIGRLINDYDLVLLQEDFAYHRIIRESARHAIRRRGSPQDRNPIADLLAPIVCGDCGSGLSTLIDLDQAALVAEHREAYDAYAGWFDSSKDAWVTKGLLAVRLRLPNGVVVDVYNSHLDAGKKHRRTRDHHARASQLAQLERAVRTFSGSGAVIVAGDFNSRADNPNPPLEGFVEALGLRETGMPPALGRWRPRLDYIFYRGDDRTEIEVVEAGEATQFVDGRGRALSDHPALEARFSIRPR
jgi:endonuclease/exonuclease/phosphatase (EEP) superfamily protein YafD